MFNFCLVKTTSLDSGEWMILIRNEKELNEWYRQFACSADIWVDLKKNISTKNFSYMISFTIANRLNSGDKVDFKKVTSLYEKINYYVKKQALTSSGAILVNKDGGFMRALPQLKVSRTIRKKELNFPVLA